MKGGFSLPERFKLTFDGQTVTDPAYMLDYGIGNEDRLDSRMGG